MSEPAENQEKDPAIPESYREAWERTLKTVEKLIRPELFQSFIYPIRLIGARENVLVLGFNDSFIRNWVYDHWASLVQEKFDEVAGQKITLEFKVEPRNLTTPASNGNGTNRSRSLPPIEELNRSTHTTVTHKSSLSLPSTLNQKHGFETFVVGSSNQFAHAASFTVAESPGRQYNPLFLYGDVGLGKTHLMNAIGLKIKEKFPAYRVHYTTFERFTNHMIESLKIEKMEEFREKYRRNCDVLLIDDIQFISGKEAIQEEFFHTFNSLYEHQKQIVLSSDRPPHEIDGLEDRLKSRFEMGLIVDIKAPEIETRVAIIYKKAEIDNIRIGQDVAFHIAKIFRSNIRELEGALLKLSAYASLTGQEISLELAKKVLKDLPTDIADQKDPEEVMKLVARNAGISLSDLKSEKKSRQLAVPRQLAMFLVRKYSHLSLPDIGTLFGGKNHTTVLHAIRQIQRLQVSDPFLKETLSKLEANIRQLS